MLTTKNRENTMSTWKLTAVALVCGLAFCGAANAATLTITFEVPGAAAVTPGSTFTVNIYGQVSDMDAANLALGAGGIASSEWTVFTPGAGAPALPNLVFGQVKSPATYQFATDHGFALPPALADYDADGDNDLVGMAVSGWNTADLGVAGPVLLGIQTWKLNEASAQIDVWASDSSKYVDPVNDAFGQGNLVALFDTVQVATSPITVGASDNVTPTVAIPGGDVVEGNWTGPEGWNNLARSVTITAEGDDPDGDNGALEYEWTMMAPGGGSLILGETGAVLNLTIGDIASLGLPQSMAEGAGWTLSVTANDGTDTSAAAQIGVFVPEPTTMGLLGFGVLALLKRRRA